jgi:hypothetical protein
MNYSEGSLSMEAQPLCLEMLMVRIRSKMQGQKRKRSFKQHLQVEAARGARGEIGH